MESTVFTNHALFKRLLNFISNISNRLEAVGLICSLLILIYLFSVFYPKLRRKFPVQVNCWFCCNYTKVPYELSNSWNCPDCKQYNGFKKDGDYNKIIKEQYNFKLNEDTFNNFKKSCSSSSSNYNSNTNGFCKLCNINQQLKIQQLALFVPLNEDNYDEEIEEYKQKLENAYKLCSNCEKVVNEKVGQQKYTFLQNQLNNKEHKTFYDKTDFYSKIASELWEKCLNGVKWCILMLSILLFFSLVLKFETENQIFNWKLPHFILIESLNPIARVILNYIHEISKRSSEISLLGIIFSLLYIVKYQRIFDPVCLLAWGLLYLLSWTNLTGIKVIICSLLLFLQFRSMEIKKIHVRKQALKKKYSFKTNKIDFNKEFDSASPLEQTCTPMKKVNSTPPEHIYQVSENKINSIKKPLPCKGVIREPPIKRENETELCLNENTKNADESTNVINTPKSSVFSKSFLATLESDKKIKELSPGLEEVDNHLSGLSLGKKQERKKRKSNFLFESLNFSEEKNRFSSSIIKPAKFIKNLSNSWTFAETNESISRSSTPSSGYSTQKADLYRHEFAKTLSPISVNPYSRRDCCDYFDGSNRFYNFNCYSHSGCIPFQQFSPGMGHTTVYTYMRPNNFPYSYSPMGFTPCSKYSNSPSRFSEMSDCDNLFQNASKSFESNKKWLKFQTITYCISVFINCLTLFGFIYFCSTGIISIDWNLPRINFFI